MKKNSPTAIFGLYFRLSASWSFFLHSKIEFLFSYVLAFLQIQGADYMKIFNPGWNFNSLNWVEISSRLNSKLPFKVALQLHVKISTQYTELKFQLGLANPRWNFNPGWKFQNFHIIDIFFSPGWKFETTHSEFLVYILKNKDDDFSNMFQMDWW